MNLNIRLGKYRPKLGDEVIDAAYYDDDELAPVMPAIDVVQQLLDEENKMGDRTNHHITNSTEAQQAAQTNEPIAGTSKQLMSGTQSNVTISSGPSYSHTHSKLTANLDGQRSTNSSKSSSKHARKSPAARKTISDERKNNCSNITMSDITEDDGSSLINNPFDNFTIPFTEHRRQDEYEFIPKSVILDVYSNDPEVKRFLIQLPRLSNESGLNEQDYKCYSCRRPIGLVFGQPRLCHFDGHHYCTECHLGEKSVIPARILCNWDFSKFPVSKRNQHFLTLISNESMFELKKVAPLLYKMCPELREIEELRRQAFFVRSYCTTCVQDSISFELTKLIWPREHLIKQTDLYSLEDLVQVKNGNLKQVLKSVITFGRQHVLSCVLCCQKGFICELCKSSQIIYPFDTESVHRCNECQSVYHKSCFRTKPDDDPCPRCQRLQARRQDS